MQVARKKSHCRALGPGVRSVIWFHGCTRRCPGCIAETMNQTATYETVSPELLANWVLQQTGIEGITLSGGEPFQQPSAEMELFLSLVKQNSDLSVICYTGYIWEELVVDGKQNILQYIDVLIDGAYIQKLDIGQRWRGSENQLFHFLTERYRSKSGAWFRAKERQVEIDLDMDGNILISGVPSKDFIDQLTNELDRRDVAVDFS